MSVVDDAVEDCIGEGRLADDVVPGVDGQLAGDDDRSVLVAVLDDFHQVAALRCCQPFGPPVVQDEQVGANDLAEQAGKPPVTMGEFEIGEQTRQAVIEDGATVAAGLLSERAGQPGFSDTAGAGDDQILPLSDPVAVRELAKQVPVELPRGAVIDVLDGGAPMAQLGRAHPTLVALRAAVRGLAVDQKAQPFGMAELGGIVLPLQLGEGLRHAIELEGTQVVQGGMVEHSDVSFSVEIAGAADIGMGDRRALRGGLWPSAMQVVPED